MANGRSPSKKGDRGRDAGGFVALPWAVLDSAAYGRLGHPARALLLEFARQVARDNNGRLLCSMNHLRKRGWRSADVVTRAKRELLEQGFIFETVKGRLPNRAAWYAVTWRTLDVHPDFDPGARAGFERSAYARAETGQIGSPVPRHGTRVLTIAPSPGTAALRVVPPDGAMAGQSTASPVPPHGNHLELPSCAASIHGTASQRGLKH